MHVFILLGIIAALAVPAQLPASEIRAGVVLLALLGYLLVTALLATADALATLRGLRNHSGLPNAVLKRHRFCSILMQAWLVGGMAGLAMLGWPWWIHVVLGIESWPLVGSLLTICPFIAALLVMWWLTYPVHHAVRRRMADALARRGEPPIACWSLGEYLAFNIRHNLLMILVPISLILLGVETLAVKLLGTAAEPPMGAQLMFTGGSLAIAGGVFLIAPVLLVRIWKTSPLPAGPLRDNLEDTCRRMGVAHRDILVWHSGGVLTNAAAMGLIAKVRYALLSDGLLNQMDAEHIRAVFAHEVVHAKKHHIAFAAVFALAAATLCSAAGWTLGEMLGGPAWLAEGATIVMLAGAWIFGFGYISRRFERQCDVIGAWACAPDGPPAEPAEMRITPEGARTFAQALQKVAELNGVALGQRNWRHGKMIDRITHIQRLGMTGGTREGIDRTVRRIKFLLVLALVAGLGLTAFQVALTWSA
jgi:STE24 endopeptidase